MGTTQNNIETYRWTNLGDSFIALGNVLQQDRTNIERNAEAQAKALYRSVYAMYWLSKGCAKNRHFLRAFKGDVCRPEGWKLLCLIRLPTAVKPCSSAADTTKTKPILHIS